MKTLIAIGFNEKILKTKLVIVDTLLTAEITAGEMLVGCENANHIDIVEIGGDSPPTVYRKNAINGCWY